MLSQLVVSALAALPLVSASSHFIMGGVNPIANERVDPIVNPGTVSSHTHVIVGPNNFDQNSNYDSLRNARCTSAPLQGVDNSAYWVPAVFYQDPNTHTFTNMVPYFNIYYFPDRGCEGEKVHAFPKGLKMLAGSPTRTSYNASSKADQAISYVCLNYNGGANGPEYAERHDWFFPDPNVCKDGIRMQIFFPQCWDGVNLDSPDHKSHLAYPTNYNGGCCSSTHPVHIVGLFYEAVIPVSKFPYWGKGAYVLANGDKSSFGFHGDFLNGWDVDVLQNVVDNCHDMNGSIEACQVLAPYINTKKANGCTLDAKVVDEDVGLGHSIPALPGCNPVRDDTSVTPSCPGASTPGFKDTTTATPSGWKDLGCIKEGTNGRALTEASTTSDTMTKTTCLNFCASKGFSFAGIEWGKECYCGNSLKNGASTATVGWEECNTRCAGSPTENCGGPQRLELFTTAPGQTPAPVSSSTTHAPSSSSIKPAPSSPPVKPAATSSSVNPVTSSVNSATSSVRPVTTSTPAAPVSTGPAGSWALTDCVSDGSARVLTGYSFSSSNMTVKLCTSTCESKGFSIAGVEYGQECYCGNSYSNGLGQKLDDGRSCYMTCVGNGERKCGGTWAVSVYTKSTTKRRKHFGRTHGHQGGIF